jgi:hypothetical protein
LEAIPILALVSDLILVFGCAGPWASTRKGELKENPTLINASYDQTFDASILVLEKMWYGIIDHDGGEGRIKAGFKDILGTKVKEINVYLTMVDDAHTEVKIDIFADLGLISGIARSSDKRRFYRELRERLEK